MSEAVSQAGVLDRMRETCRVKQCKHIAQFVVIRNRGNRANKLPLNLPFNGHQSAVNAALIIRAKGNINCLARSSRPGIARQHARQNSIAIEEVMFQGRTNVEKNQRSQTPNRYEMQGLRVPELRGVDAGNIGNGEQIEEAAWYGDDSGGYDEPA